MKMFTRHKAKVMMLSGLILGAVVLAAMPGMVASSAAAEGKTIKIGAVTNLTWPLGVGFKKYLDVIVPMFNKEGGLTIGGERYDVELILYDTKGNAETGRAAVERLVHRDKVKFILGDETVDAWLPLTEANKVLVAVQSPSPSIYNPKLKYCFEGTYLQTSAASVWGWFSENYPQMKTVACAHPDNMIGRGEHNKALKLAAGFDQKVLDSPFYPADTTDFSVIATKIKRLNPTFFTTAGGGTINDSMLYKALYEAGWRGKILSYVGVNVRAIARVISLDMVEGMIGGSSDIFQLDTLPPQAKKVKDAYVAKYGEWDNPNTVYWPQWDVVINALKKAQSLDTDKVAAMVANGMEFESVLGPAKMVARPDFKNNRTVSLLTTVYMMEIVKGQRKHIGTISLDAGYKYNKRLYNW
jgi:branched-chain amino acid transport system substrate-binding protein